MKINPLQMIASQGQTLAQQRPDEPRGFSLVKELILDVLAIVCALGFGYYYKLYLAGQVHTWMLIGSLSLFCIISLLQTLLTEYLQYRIPAIILEIIAFLVLFLGESLQLLLGIAGLMFIFFIWGEFTSRWELKNNLRVRFFRSLRPSLNKIITAVILMTLLLYLPHVSGDKVFISHEVFDGFFAWTTKLLNSIYPQFDFNSTVGKLGESIAKSQLEDNETFKKLPARSQTQALTTASGQVIETLGKSIGVALDPNASVNQTFYNFILSVLQGWQTQYKNSFLLGWAIIVFLTVRSIGFFFTLIISGIAFVIYQLLVAAEVIVLIAHNSTHEVAKFS